MWEQMPFISLCYIIGYTSWTYCLSDELVLVFAGPIAISNVRVIYDRMSVGIMGTLGIINNCVPFVQEGQYANQSIKRSIEKPSNQFTIQPTY